MNYVLVTLALFAIMLAPGLFPLSASEKASRARHLAALDLADAARARHPEGDETE